jgi:hypothetical protein
LLYVMSGSNPRPDQNARQEAALALFDHMESFFARFRVVPTAAGGAGVAGGPAPEVVMADANQAGTSNQQAVRRRGLVMSQKSNSGKSSVSLQPKPTHIPEFTSAAARASAMSLALCISASSISL